MATQRPTPYQHSGGLPQHANWEHTTKLMPNIIYAELSSFGFTNTTGRNGNNMRNEYYKLQYCRKSGKFDDLWVERDVASDTVTVTKFTRTDGSMSYRIFKITNLCGNPRDATARVADGDGKPMASIRKNGEELKIFNATGTMMVGKQVLDTNSYKISYAHARTVNADASIIAPSRINTFKIPFAFNSSVEEKIHILSLALRMYICELGLCGRLGLLNKSPLPCRDDTLTDRFANAVIYRNVTNSRGITTSIEKIERKIAADFQTIPRTPVQPQAAERFRQPNSNPNAAPNPHTIRYTIKPIATADYPKRDFLIVRDCTLRMPVYVIEVRTKDDVRNVKQPRQIAYMKKLSAPNPDRNTYECSNIKGLNSNSIVRHRRNESLISVEELTVSDRQSKTTQFIIRFEPQEDDYTAMYTFRNPASEEQIDGYCIARDGRLCTTVVMRRPTNDYTAATMLFTALKLLTFATQPNNYPLSNEVIDSGSRLWETIKASVADPESGHLRGNNQLNFTSMDVRPEFGILDYFEHCDVYLSHIAKGILSTIDYYLLATDAPRVRKIIAKVKKRENDSIESISLYSYDKIDDPSESASAQKSKPYVSTFICQFTDHPQDSKEIICTTGPDQPRQRYGFINKEHHRILDDKRELMATIKTFFGTTQASAIKAFRAMACSTYGLGDKIAIVQLTKDSVKFVFFKIDFMDARLKALILGYCVYLIVEQRFHTFSKGQLTISSVKELNLR